MKTYPLNRISYNPDYDEEFISPLGMAADSLNQAKRVARQCLIDAPSLHGVEIVTEQGNINVYRDQRMLNLWAGELNEMTPLISYDDPTQMVGLALTTVLTPEEAAQIAEILDHYANM